MWHKDSILKQLPYFNCDIEGDPFILGTYILKWMERNVLDHYASLWNAKWPHDITDPDTYWGYILTMGSSEGNIYGLWNARDYLEGKLMLTDESLGVPVRMLLYTSQDL